MRDAAIDTHRAPARGAGRPRPAGAPLLDDMAGENPIGRAAPRRGGITSAAIAAQRLGGGRPAGRSKAGPGIAVRLRARIPRVRPLKVVTVAAFGVALVGIVANAMVFQRGHHPSPLFGLGHAVDGAPDAAAKTAAAVPAPAPPVPAERTGTIPPAPVVPAEPAPVAAATAPKPVHHASPKIRPDEAAKAKPPEKPGVAAAHPRPGHPAATAKADLKADPLTKLLAAPARVAKPETKPAPAARPEPKAAGTPAIKPLKAAADAAHPAKAAAEPAAHPHHRIAAAKPAAEAE